MKKFLVLIFLVASSNLSFGQVLDIKTKMSEKAELSPLKIGTEIFLIKKGIKILDTGEDFAVWIKDYRKVKDGNRCTVTVLVKITPTTAFAEKAPLAEKTVSFMYATEPSKNIDIDDATTKVLREKLQRNGELAMTEARTGGEVVADAIIELYNKVKK